MKKVNLINKKVMSAGLAASLLVATLGNSSCSALNITACCNNVESKPVKAVATKAEMAKTVAKVVAAAAVLGAAAYLGYRYRASIAETVTKGSVYLTEKASEAADAAKNFGAGVVNKTNSGLSSMKSGITGFFNKAGSWFKSKASTPASQENLLPNNTTNSTTAPKCTWDYGNAYNDANTTGAGFFNKIGSGFNASKAYLANKTSAAADAVKNFGAGAVNKTSSGLSSMKSGITGFFNKAGSWFKSKASTPASQENLLPNNTTNSTADSDSIFTSENMWNNITASGSAGAGMVLAAVTKVVQNNLPANLNRDVAQALEYGNITPINKFSNSTDEASIESPVDINKIKEAINKCTKIETLDELYKRLDLAESCNNSQNAEFVQDFSENMENDYKHSTDFTSAEQADELSKNCDTFEEDLKHVKIMNFDEFSKSSDLAAYVPDTGEFHCTSVDGILAKGTDANDSAELDQYVNNSTELDQYVNNSAEVAQYVNNSKELDQYILGTGVASTESPILTKQEANSTEVAQVESNMCSGLAQYVNNSTELDQYILGTGVASTESPILTKQGSNSTELAQYVNKSSEVGQVESDMCSNLAASYDNSQNAEFVQESSENMENDCKQPAGFIPAERADELSKKYNTLEEILKNENLK